MKGHVARKGCVWYAVIYGGVDPITGKERRRWHRAGTDRAEAEALAARLAAVEDARRNGYRAELTLAGFLSRYWLPAKRLDLEASTFDGYQRVVRLHALPHIGDIPLRGLRAERLEHTGSAECRLWAARRGAHGSDLRERNVGFALTTNG